MLDRDIALQVISYACKDYQDKYNKLCEMEMTVKEVERTIISMWKYFDICPVCRGEKQYFQRSCAEDEGDIRLCKCCNGTGRFPTNGVPDMYTNFMFRLK